MTTVKAFLRSVARPEWFHLQRVLAWLPLILRYYMRSVTARDVAYFTQTGCWRTAPGEQAHCLVLSHYKVGTHNQLILNVCERLNRELFTLNVGFWLFRALHEYRDEYERGGSDCSLVSLHHAERARRRVHAAMTEMGALWHWPARLRQVRRAVSTSRLNRNQLGHIGERFAWHQGCATQCTREVQEVLLRVCKMAMRRIEILVNLVPVGAITLYLVPHLRDLDWHFVLQHGEPELRQMINAVLPRAFSSPFGNKDCMWNWSKKEYTVATESLLHYR